MGLSMSVGLLAFYREEESEGADWLRKALKQVNRVLKSNDLPPHEEPEVLPPLESRFHAFVGQPYGMLHYLRRAVAHALSGRKTLKPFDGDDPFEDPLYDSVLCSSESHVVCHSDCEGFYVPIDFPESLYDELPDRSKRCIPGGILGSSQGVMHELIRTAPLLKIPLRNGKLSDREAEKLNHDKEADTPLWTERMIWFKFYEVARLSIAHGTAIVFG
jgi:hypothetical protein